MQDNQERAWWLRPDVMWPLVISLLASIPIAIVVAIIFSKEAQERFWIFCHWLARWTVVPLVIVVAAALLGAGYWLGQKAEKMKEMKRTKKEEGRRWETYTRIRYGHLKYRPFLDYTDGDIPAGLGVDLLKELLGDRGRAIQIQPYESKGEWDSIFSGLIERKYDVVATPLFATFERSKQVRFTSPLFFSNVGLYVSKAVFNLPIWENLAFENLRKKIADAGEMTDCRKKLQIVCIKGEISSTLAHKYADDAVIKEADKEATLSSLFDQVARSSDPHRVLFCESFYAYHQPSVQSGQVVNVLPWHQILYPVCFAVRFGDDHLMNLLNIRLLEFTRKEGALDRLAKTLADHGGVSEEIVRQHFVAEWPVKVENKPKELEAHA